MTDFNIDLGESEAIALALQENGIEANLEFDDYLGSLRTARDML